MLEYQEAYKLLWVCDVKRKKIRKSSWEREEMGSESRAATALSTLLP